MHLILCGLALHNAHHVVDFDLGLGGDLLLLALFATAGARLVAAFLLLLVAALLYLLRLELDWQKSNDLWTDVLLQRRSTGEEVDDENEECEQHGTVTHALSSRTRGAAAECCY